MKQLGYVLIAVGFLNFIAFASFCSKIGGSAGNGTVRDGRFFVSDHGREREVPEDTFRLNSLHGRSLWVTHPLAAIGMLLAGAASTRSNCRPH